MLFEGYKNSVLINGVCTSNAIFASKLSDGTVRCERDKEIIILMSKYTIYNMKIFPSLQKKLRTERNGFPGPLNSKSRCAYYYYIYSKHG
jgi:hypothetical protein